MSEQPTPGAVEAVAKVMMSALDECYDDVQWGDNGTTEGDSEKLAEIAITAYLAHQQQHAPDTLVADLAAIVANHLISIVDVAFNDQYEATVEIDDYQFHVGCGETIADAVAALRRKIEEAE